MEEKKGGKEREVGEGGGGKRERKGCQIISIRMISTERLQKLVIYIYSFIHSMTESSHCIEQEMYLIEKGIQNLEEVKKSHR